MNWPKNAAFIFILIFASTVHGTEQETPDLGWPRMFESKGCEVVVHQPQLEAWEKHEIIRGKAAVAVKLKGKEDTFYGALSIETNTETDFDSRTVLLKDFRITNIYFPNINEKSAAECSRIIRETLPKNKTLMVSLDRIIAGLEKAKAMEKGVEVNLKPPPIYRSEVPAILVSFMGEPKLEPVKGAPGLLYVVNTNWDILLELESSRYYMLNKESWLVTGDIMKGPWKAAGSLPGSFTKLPDDDNWRAVKKKIPGKPAQTVPKVFVATQPSELLVTEGTPSYSPITGTKLLYVTNTESDLFLFSPDGSFYFLTAGRWFRSMDLDGPWSSASENMPEEFRKIPADHAKAHVLSSVPGSPEAEAAVLLASIPRKATVNRNETTVNIVYEGKPEFTLIKGTSSPVHYAVNTPYTVFKAEGKYYAVHDGVWFYSSSPSGPWVVCTEIPQVIYTIPPEHPKHNVTYVYVYDSTPETVTVGYTSGYSGTYVAATGVLMFGLGYWLGHHDDHYHHYHYHSHYFAYGSAARYDYYRGGYYSSARHYGPYGGAVGWSGYNPSSGTYYRGGYAQGPYGSAFAREAYNPYTDRYAAQAKARTPYGSWGRSVVADGDDWARAGHKSRYGKTVGGIETSKGGAAVGGYNKWTGQGAIVGKDKYGDVYVGRDGNVYKREGESWQKKSRDGWETVERTSTRSQTGTSSITKEARSAAGTGARSTSKEARTTVGTGSRSTSKEARTTTGKGSRSSIDRSADKSRFSSPQRSSGSSSVNRLNRDFSSRNRGNQRAKSFQSRMPGRRR